MLQRIVTLICLPAAFTALLFLSSCKLDPVEPDPDPDPTDTTEEKITDPGLASFSMTQLNPRAGGQFYDIMAGSASNSFFALGPGGLQRSTNGGDSWSTTLAKAQILGWGQSTDGKLWAAVRDDGLYFSENDGQSWAKLPSTGIDWNAGFNISQLALPADGDLFLALTSHVSMPPRLYKSADGGQSFEALSFPSFTGLGFEIAAATDEGLLLQTINTLFRTADDGNSWTILLEKPNLQRMVVTPDGWCLLSSGTSIWRGPDNQAAGWEETGANGWMCGQLEDGRLMARIVNKNLHWSDDKGKTWWPMGIFTGFPNKAVGNGGRVLALNELFQLNYLDQQVPNWYIRHWPPGAVNAWIREDNRWILATQSGLYISYDQGGKWYSRMDFDIYRIHALAAEPGGKIYVSLGGILHILDREAQNIEKSLTLNSQWERFTAMAWDESKKWMMVAIGEDDPGLQGRSGYLTYTNDGGNNWSFTFPYGNLTQNSYITHILSTAVPVCYFLDYAGNSWKSQGFLANGSWEWDRKPVSVNFPSNKRITGVATLLENNIGLELHLTDDARLHFQRRIEGTFTTEYADLPVDIGIAKGMWLDSNRRLWAWGEKGIFRSVQALELD